MAAELGAVLLGDRLEIGSAIANHAAYLGQWVELLKESPQVLLQVLSDARKVRTLEVDIRTLQVAAKTLQLKPCNQNLACCCIRTLQVGINTL